LETPVKKRAYLTLLLCVAVSLSVACAAPTDPKVAKRRMPTLAKLCMVHATDKCPDIHNYVELYGVFFRPLRKRAERVLEIGVLDGESVRLWEAYFPRATIFGIDIEDTSQYETERIRTFVADQANREQLSQFIDEHGSAFDIVIDDGGHTMEQQQVSFGFFFPHLRSKGIYIIEDIHTSFPELHSGYGVDEDAGNSTFTMIANFVREGSFSSRYLSAPELAALNSEVDHCLYSYRPNQYHSDFFLCVKK
jgi:hypothetical protein